MHPKSSFHHSICNAVRVCTALEYETRPPTETSNRVCARVTTCTEGNFEAVSPTATSDRYVLHFPFFDMWFHAPAFIHCTNHASLFAIGTCDLLFLWYILSAQITGI